MTFYLLHHGWRNRGLAEWDHDIMAFLAEGHDCSVNPQHPTGKEGRICDLHVTLASDKVADFVWTWYSECLITDRVLDLFRKAEITGFKTKPVTVTGVKRGSLKNVPRLHEMIVKGWGGEVRKESGITVKERCPGCGRTLYGPVLDWSKAIDERRWDGTDIFTLWPLPAYIFAAEPVASLNRENGLRGSGVIPIADVTITQPKYALGCTVGRLEDYFSPKVARRRQRDILF